MSKARLVITAVVVEGRLAAEVAAEYGVSRSWIYELVARYPAEGAAAFQASARLGAPNEDALISLLAIDGCASLKRLALTSTS